ncbi:MAG: MqnA/MqnD/SBP family protein [Candidatus Hydrogenedens sp.]
MICLSGLFSYEAVPLIRAVKRISTIQFEWLTLPALCDSFIQKKVDAILCPPLMAVIFPEGMIVPGVGIATSGRIPAPVLYSKKPIYEIKTIFINDQYKHWENWFKVVWSLLNRNSIEKLLSFNRKESGDEDAYLVDFIKEKKEQEGMYCYNIGELWKQVSIYPMVCWVWLCRGDSDYRQIRNVLGHIWDGAKENLTELKRGILKSDEIPEEFITQIDGIREIYYNLASLEFEGIHWFVEQARNCGVIPQDAEIHIC